MSSVTDDRIEAALERYWKEIEAFYDKVFRDTEIPTNSAVWGRLTDMEFALWEALAERPLTAIAIRGVMADFTRRCKKLFLDAKESGGIVARSWPASG